VFASNERFIITCLCLLSIFLLSGIGSSLWMAALAILATIVLLNLRIRNIFLSSFLIYVYTLFILTPNKFYYIVVIPGWKLLLPSLKGGYSVGFGVLPSNVVLVFCVIFLIRNLWKRRTPLHPIKNVLLTLGIPILILAVITLSTAANKSPFPSLSLTWTIQYLQCYVVAFLVLYTWVYFKKQFHYFYHVFLVSTVLEFCLSIWQFLHQEATGLAIETGFGSSFAKGLDEDNAIYRVNGTFLYHNQLALIIACSAIILFLAVVQTRRSIYIVGLICSGIIIVLTQTRSVWITTALLCIWLAITYKKQLTHILRRVNKKRIILYCILLMTAFSYIYIPRIILSFNLSYVGAGIPIREKMVREGIDALTFSPWVGYGAGTNEYVLNTLAPNGYTAIFPAAIHMAFLQLLLEIGIIGFCLALFPFFLIIRTYVNTLIHSKQTHRPPGFIFLEIFAYGGFIFTVYYAFQPHVGIIEFPFLGWLLGIGLIGVYLMKQK
jgi:O-antigen ligase